MSWNCFGSHLHFTGDLLRECKGLHTTLVLLRPLQPQSGRTCPPSPPWNIALGIAPMEAKRRSPRPAEFFSLHCSVPSESVPTTPGVFHVGTCYRAQCIAADRANGKEATAERRKASQVRDCARIDRNQVLISSSDCHAHDRRVLRSCQLSALHHCRRPRSHLRGSPLWSHAEPPLHHPQAPSSPRWPAPLDSSPARAVPLWFPSFSPEPWRSPPFPSSRL